MSENHNQYDLFDPLGMMRSMRNESMDSWAKMMVQFVNTEAYADATGKMIDTWLSSSAPFRKLLEDTMTKWLEQLHMPSREDVTRLAERLTNVELRLDDMDAKLDEILAAVKAGSGG